jgi:hypothetical protein
VTLHLPTTIRSFIVGLLSLLLFSCIGDSGRDNHDGDVEGQTLFSESEDQTTSQDDGRRDDETAIAEESHQLNPSRYELVVEVSANVIPGAELEIIRFWIDSERRRPGGPNTFVDLVSISSIGEAEADASRKVFSVEYREKELRFLKSFAQEVDSPHPFLAFADLNRNGIDELFFLSVFGSGSVVDVLEYDGANFESQVTEVGSIEQVTGLELVSEVPAGPYGFRVYGIGGIGDPPNVRDWVEYGWDTDTRDYVIVDSGLDEWEGDWFSDE